MTPEEAIKAHLAQRPELPRPVPPVESPEYQGYLRAMNAWILRHEELDAALLPLLEFTRQIPVVSPAADYDWRDYDAPAKRRSGPRPAWCGATREYMAQKARESRARKTDRQRALRAAEKAKAQEGAKAALESAKKRRVA